MIKGQSKKHSLIESLTNIAIGYVIAISTQLLIFPLFGIHPPLRDNLMIGAIFTVISLVRSYFLRRLFNLWHVRGIYKVMFKQKINLNEFSKTIDAIPPEFQEKDIHLIAQHIYAQQRVKYRESNQKVNVIR